MVMISSYVGSRLRGVVAGLVIASYTLDATLSTLLPRPKLAIDKQREQGMARARGPYLAHRLALKDHADPRGDPSGRLKALAM